jgi:hyperosmotically inducible periplasmic protein
MLPLYGMGVSRYPESCRMTLNKYISQSSEIFCFGRKLGHLALGLSLAVAMMATSGAGQSNTPNGQTSKGENNYGSSLAREIHRQIQALPFYSVFDSIIFSLDGRRVTLSGQVLRPTLKRHAEATIKSLEDVDTVIDEIEVLPNSPTDDELRRAIYRAIFEDPALAPYAVQTVPSIHIIVKSGNVALEGTVKSAADKNLTAIRAGGVANVGGVKNDLTIQPSHGAADSPHVR